MIKKIYAIYDTKANGIPGDVFMDINDGCVIRGLSEKQKQAPISKELACDLVLLCLGEINVQSDLNTVSIVDNNTRIVGYFKDFMTCSNDTPSSESNT